MVWALVGAVVGVLPPTGFVHRPVSAYSVRRVQGFTVYVSPDLPDDAKLARVLELSEAQLRNVVQMVPPAVAETLRKVPIFVERNNPDFSCACYHTSRNWLAKRGYPLGKHRSIEISNPGNFIHSVESNQPMILLHELSHAYHDRALGADHPKIRAAYENAIHQGLYGDVQYSLGGQKPHYGGSNAWEYFAELSEAYFGRNDFFPFNREQLAEYDPCGYALIERLWLGK